MAFSKNVTVVKGFQKKTFLMAFEKKKLDILKTPDKVCIPRRSLIKLEEHIEYTVKHL